MKNLCPILGLLLAASVSLRAQVSVEVSFDQEQFLPGETLTAIIKIRNRSGQTLQMGREADWLTFAVESHDGFVVTKSGEAPVTGEFTLASSQVATKRVDLAPYFTLARPGRYRVTATVRIKEWNGQAVSEPKAFDIISGVKLWSQEFGVPARSPAATAQPPEIRRYTLQQANYLRQQLRLYFRLTDESGAKLFKVYPIGPMVSFSQPEPLVDSRSQLHLLYQNGPHSFSYTVINSDGEMVVRQTYDYTGSRPRLQAGRNGQVGVTGGVRRPLANDLPAPEKKMDEPHAPKP